MRPLIEIQDLPHGESSHTLVGAGHGDLPVSLILVHSAPGAGPSCTGIPVPRSS
jgi:hypothetical protein